jgi:hypothetical protein
MSQNQKAKEEVLITTAVEETLVEVTEQQSRWCGDRRKILIFFLLYKKVSM